MVINTILMLVLCFLLPPWVENTLNNGRQNKWASRRTLVRHELLWIYDMFNSHDEEHAGFLGEFEVRRLMKYMGTLDLPKTRGGNHMGVSENSGTPKTSQNDHF